MGTQRTSSDAEIKTWKKPELTELDISETRLGQQGEWDGDGLDGERPPIDS